MVTLGMSLMRMEKSYLGKTHVQPKREAKLFQVLQKRLLNNGQNYYKERNDDMDRTQYGHTDYIGRSNLFSEIDKLQTYKMFSDDTELYLAKKDVVRLLSQYGIICKCHNCEYWDELSLRIGDGRCSLDWRVTNCNDYCSYGRGKVL